ncbi:ABC transporter, phosphonate, periplasmic substrate-binding protein [mine drainage metagenome]|uniref:ABC transporter, phosphonate, periplasmic substrate-binding protein n=1 Tax=mine drainage metagenome TaxID=410659 RepID=A0A1J5QM69_9ZZZZ
MPTHSLFSMRPLGGSLMLVAALLMPAAAAHAAITLAVSEGTSGGLDNIGYNAFLKYQALVDILAKATMQPAQIITVPSFAELAAGAKAHRYDFIFARPSNYPAQAMRSDGYQFVATARPDGQCWIVAPKGSPIADLKQTAGRRWVMPQKVSYMARFCAAALRDAGVDMARQSVQYTHSQGAVLSALDHGMADVGGVASYGSGVDKWLMHSGRVIFKSPSQPYFPLVAGPNISARQVQDIQKSLLGLSDSAGGQAALKRMGITGFDTTTRTSLSRLLDWLGAEP